MAPKILISPWLWSVMTDHLRLKSKCFSRGSPFLCHFYSKAKLFLLSRIFFGFFTITENKNKNWEQFSHNMIIWVELKIKSIFKLTTGKFPISARISTKWSLFSLANSWCVLCLKSPIRKALRMLSLLCVRPKKLKKS